MTAQWYFFRASAGDNTNGVDLMMAPVATHALVRRFICFRQCNHGKRHTYGG